MINQSTTKLSPPRKHIPAVYMRGGSSKALFFHEEDIPPPGTERDAMLKRVMGSPDPLQIDGMGGTKAVTSKVAIIKASAREDADVDYTFGQVGVVDGTVGYSGNCGNISAGVGPFAIEEGLVGEFREGQAVDEKIKAREVRIYNTNTDKILIAHVPVSEDGAPLEKGEFSMPAVPGTGAPILMDYVNTIGARLQSGALPTGNTTDVVQLNGKEVAITFCDVGNPIVFVNAKDLGMTARESAEQITSNTDLIARADELRGRAAQLVGMCKDWSKVDEQSPFLPMVVAIAGAQKDDEHINARLFLDHMCHESMAGSGAICTTACSRIPGTLVNKVLNQKALEDNTFRISHPVGVMPVFVKTKQDPKTVEGIPDFETLSFVRTARRIMEGRLLVPEE